MLGRPLTGEEIGLMVSMLNHLQPLKLDLDVGTQSLFRGVGEGAAPLALASLVTAKLRRAQVDVAMKIMAAAPSLRRVDLSYTTLGAQALAGLTLPHLEELSIVACPNLDKITVLNAFPSLVKLDASLARGSRKFLGGVNLADLRQLTLNQLVDNGRDARWTSDPIGRLLQGCPSLETLSLNGTAIDDAALEGLRFTPMLLEFEAMSAGWSASALCITTLAHFNHCRHLRRLAIDAPLLTDAGLQGLDFPSLTTFELRAPHVRFVQGLSALPQLQQLKLALSEMFGSDGLAGFCAPALESWEILETFVIPDGGGFSLPEHRATPLAARLKRFVVQRYRAQPCETLAPLGMPLLEELALCNGSGVATFGRALAACPMLRCLDLSESDDVVDGFAGDEPPDLPHLEQVLLVGCRQVSSLRTLGRWRHTLRRLDLSGTQVAFPPYGAEAGNAAGEAWTFPLLDRLHLARCAAIGPFDLDVLNRCTRLAVLDLSFTNIAGGVELGKLSLPMLRELSLKRCLRVQNVLGLGRGCRELLTLNLSGTPGDPRRSRRGLPPLPSCPAGAGLPSAAAGPHLDALSSAFFTPVERGLTLR